MDILVSTLCDFAADYQGKLCIQGGFDSLVARQFPVVHPVCAVALRICLTPEDEGTHELGLSIVDADGTPLDKERMPIKINFPVPAFPEGASFFTRNLIMNFQGLRFEKPGNYSIDLTVDGEVTKSRNKNIHVVIMLMYLASFHAESMNIGQNYTSSGPIAR